MSKASGIATATYKAVEISENKIRIVSGAWKKMPIQIKPVIKKSVKTGGGWAGVSEEPFIYIDKNYVSYEYNGNYNGFGQSESIEGGDTLTLQDAEDEGSTNIPNILPLLQIGLGVRATITPNLSLKGEVNFWDGLVYRFGISGRF